jgi:hypothetical protein
MPLIILSRLVHPSILLSHFSFNFTLHRWKMFGLTWVAWAFTIVSVQHCSFFKMGPANLDYVSLDGMGFFYHAYYDDEKRDFLGCIQYKVDASWSGAAAFKASRVFGVVLAMISTSLLVMVNMMVLFLRLDDRRRLLHSMIRVLVPIAFVCSIFTLAVFSMDECQKDDMQCPPGAGGVVAIINMFVFAVLSVFVFLAPTPSQPVFALFKDAKTTRSKRTPSKRSKKAAFDDPREPRPNRALPLPAKSKRRKTHHRKKPRPAPPPAQFYPETPPSHERHEEIMVVSNAVDIHFQPLAPPSETFSDTTCSSERDQEIVVVANPNIQVDMIPAGRRTVTTFTHPDGSKTITCKIRQISERERMDPGV